ncbi:MAG: hypothetical protein ACTSUB_09170 [Candidatus Thorarchaeota archaeon]
MRIICSAKGIDLYAPDDSYISFSNSPYIGHRTQTAVDIYPASQEWGAQLPSPISGKIVDIKTLKMGKEREFTTDNRDYAIAIQSENDAGAIVRVLHCRPNIELNEFIEKGDSLGEAIRSRYFNYWTGPHAHIDILHTKNFPRSSKSFRLEIPVVKKTSSNDIQQSTLECTAHKISADFILAISKDAQYTRIENYIGHSSFISDDLQKGILDAGFPHYKQGGSIHVLPVECNEQVSSWGIEIGTIERNYGQISRFIINRCRTVLLDKIPVRGISCFLYSRAQLVKGLIPIQIIPRSYNDFPSNIDEGDSFTLSLI